MEPIKGKPEQPTIPTSQETKGGRNFFSPANPLSLEQSGKVSELVTMKSNELEAYGYNKLMLEPGLAKLLPDPKVFRLLLARVTLELQLNLDDPKLQRFILKLVEQQVLPKTLLSNPSSMEQVLRILATMVTQELEILATEESFSQLLYFIAGVGNPDKTSLVQTYLSLIQYKARMQQKAYWWEFQWIEFTDGQEGLLQFLYGPGQKTPHKIVVMLPIQELEQDGTKGLKQGKKARQEIDLTIPGDQKRVGFWWLEPERTTLFVNSSVMEQTQRKKNEFFRLVFSQVKNFHFNRVNDSVQFPIGSADSYTKDIDLGKGIDLFG